MIIKNDMRNTIKKMLFVSILVIVFLLPFSLFAETEAGIDYKPISVVPGLTPKEGTPLTLEGYLNRMFVFSIGAAAVLAVVQITLGGIEYMTSSAVGSIENAKSKIWNAVIGLLLILSTFAILNQINPDLVNIRLTVPQTQTDDAGNPIQPVGN